MERWEVLADAGVRVERPADRHGRGPQRGERGVGRARLDDDAVTEDADPRAVVERRRADPAGDGRQRDPARAGLAGGGDDVAGDGVQRLAGVGEARGERLHWRLRAQVGVAWAIGTPNVWHQTSTVQGPSSSAISTGTS